MAICTILVPAAGVAAVFVVDSKKKRMYLEPNPARFGRRSPAGAARRRSLCRLMGHCQRLKQLRRQRAKEHRWQVPPNPASPRRWPTIDVVPIRRSRKRPLPRPALRPTWRTRYATNRWTPAVNTKTKTKNSPIADNPRDAFVQI